MRPTLTRNTVSRSVAAWFLLRLLLGLVAAAGGFFLGLGWGEQLGFAIAASIDRDPAELEDMNIWCTISGGVVTSAVAVWLVIWVTGAGRGARTIALGAVGVALGISSLMILVSYDWPKSEGTPLIDYELRLPEGVYQPPGPIDLTIWNENASTGCYVNRIVRYEPPRYEISGKIVLPKDNRNPVMSLRIEDIKIESYPRPGVTRYWRLPYSPDAALEKQWQPWQRIEFIAAPHGETVPPEGNYEIRYRLRRYE
jgi:hypothetical protein